MKKQLTFLYILLAVFLLFFFYAGYSLVTMDTEPEIPKSFSEYSDYQEQVQILQEPEEIREQVYLDFDMEEMKTVNPDFDSWLMIPDTSISYPVVMPEDNRYYLKRSFSRQSSAYGCLFFDVACPPGSENRVIYGHNMGIRRTEMFSPLVLFQEQTYAQEHKTAYLSNASDGAADSYELFAVVNLKHSKYPEFDYAQPKFETESDKAQFISFLQSLSIYETEFDPSRNLLILSTCNREFGGDNRLLICFGQ